MTVESHSEAWRNNVRSKAKEIQNILNEVLGLLPLSADEKRKPKFEERLQTLTAKCTAMHDLYGPGLAPHDLTELTQQLGQWKTNLQNPDLTRRIAELWKPIGKLDGNEKLDEFSFTVILEKYKQDERLQECLEKLIAALEELLAEGDETLTSQGAKELTRVLDELKKRKAQSLFDLRPWVEFALVSTGAVVDQFTGTPLATIAAAAVIAAKESQIRVGELFGNAYDDFIMSLQLKGHAKWESLFGSNLKEATAEEIQEAIESPAGLKNLERNCPGPALLSSAEEKISPD